MFAFTHGCEVGIDLEQIRPMNDMKSVARRFFSPEETADLMSIPEEQREHAFFLCWTRKEAFIKASGEGLSFPLDCFRVTLEPGQPARLVHLGHSSEAASEWTIHDLETVPTYAAALAYRDTERPVLLLPVLDPGQLLSLEESAARP